MESLNADVLDEMLLRLDLTSLVRLSATCRLLRNYTIRRDLLWKRHLQEYAFVREERQPVVKLPRRALASSYSMLIECKRKRLCNVCGRLRNLRCRLVMERDWCYGCMWRRVISSSQLWNFLKRNGVPCSDRRCILARLTGKGKIGTLGSWFGEWYIVEDVLNLFIGMDDARLAVAFQKEQKP